MGIKNKELPQLENISILPTHLGVINIGVLKNWKQVLDNLEYKEANTGVTDAVATVNKMVHQLPPFSDLHKKFLQISNKWIKMVGFDYELFITSSWINKYKPGGIVRPHSHPETLLSGCYYFEDSTPIVFSEMPHDSVFLSDLVKTRKQTFTYTPKAGDLCVFLSTTYHESLPSDETRYSFVFDAYPKGFNYYERYEAFIKNSDPTMINNFFIKNGKISLSSIEKRTRLE